jgi:hypothetical protein
MLIGSPLDRWHLWKGWYGYQGIGNNWGIRYAMSRAEEIENGIMKTRKLINALGNSLIMTAQRFYAQMDRESAGRRIEEAWKRKLDLTPKTHLIETEKYLSGYA